MNFYSLQGAVELAKRRHRVTYFWSPLNLSCPDGFKWIHDPTATAGDYQLPNLNTVKLIIKPDGSTTFIGEVRL